MLNLIFRRVFKYCKNYKKYCKKKNNEKFEYMKYMNLERKVPNSCALSRRKVSHSWGEACMVGTNFSIPLLDEKL